LKNEKYIQLQPVYSTKDYYSGFPSIYNMELKRMEDSLELFLEENRNLPLKGFVLILFMFRLEYVCARIVLEEMFDKIENILLANSLIDAII